MKKFYILGARVSSLSCLKLTRIVCPYMAHVHLISELEIVNILVLFEVNALDELIKRNK